jgi:hypothetical protein
MALDLEKLAAICERLGSDQDGERAAAALLAHRMVRSANFTWREMFIALQGQASVAPQKTAPNATPVTPNEHRAVKLSPADKGRLLADVSAMVLTRSSRVFVNSLEQSYAQRKDLSMRQTAALLTIFERMKARPWK